MENKLGSRPKPPSTEGLNCEYTIHQSSSQDPNLKKLKYNLLSWVNSFLSPDGITIRDLIVDFADGSNLATLLEKLTNRRVAVDPNTSVMASKQNVATVLNFVETCLGISANGKWTVEGIVEKDQVSVLCLLTELALLFQCPHPLPPKVWIAVTKREINRGTAKSKTTVFPILGGNKNDQAPPVARSTNDISPQSSLSIKSHGGQSGATSPPTSSAESLSASQPTLVHSFGSLSIPKKSATYNPKASSVNELNQSPQKPDSKMIKQSSSLDFKQFSDLRDQMATELAQQRARGTIRATSSPQRSEERIAPNKDIFDVMFEVNPTKVDEIAAVLVRFANSKLTQPPYSLSKFHSVFEFQNAYYMLLLFESLIGVKVDKTMLTVNATKYSDMIVNAKLVYDAFTKHGVSLQDGPNDIARGDLKVIMRTMYALFNYCKEHGVVAPSPATSNVAKVGLSI